jgi:Concanavalin A-like lectin/glucanases superfamily/Carbohydrate family 9 binding domain-like
MRTHNLLLISALALCAVSQPTRANDIEPGKEFYTVRYAPKPIVLDGDLSEWSGVPVIADPKFAQPKFSGTNASPNYVLFEEFDGGTWTGPDDQTSAVQICYDADNVYFGFVVTDDYHENAARSAWNGDSVQLMIADASRTTQIALYNYALAGIETDANLNDTNNIIVNHEAGPACTADTCATLAVITRNTNTHKTVYEIKLPKEALGLTTLKGGPSFGLGMAINDGDAGVGQNGQKGWGGLGAHAIVHGKTPSETALMTLATGNDIEPTKEYYTALRITNSITLDGKLTEWSGVPVIADPKFAQPKFSGTNDSPNYVLFEEFDGGTWTGPDDQTSAVQVAYDADNVYFGFVVTDDYHENAARSAWNGDSVQLMIADATRTTQIALYNYALAGIETDANLNDTNNIIVNHEAGPPCTADTCATSAIITRDTTNKKTFYEVKLPAASLGLTPPLAAGMQFGLGMAINDGDAGVGQNGQKGWGGLGAHAIVHGKTPSETALVTLGTTVSGSDVLFLSSIDPTFNSFTFRATDKGASIVDPINTKLIIDNQTVPLVASPKVVDATDFSYKPTSPFPPNSDHTYTIQVKDTLGNTVTAQGAFRTDNYSLDKLHGYYAQIRSGSALTPDKGGHTGQAGDSALDFGAAAVATAALVTDASFLNSAASNDMMTASVWVKKYDNINSSSAFWVESPSSAGPRGFLANIPMSDGTIVFDVGGNIPGDSEISESILTVPSFTDDSWTNWHHWVFVKNVETKQIWLDGQLFVEGTGATVVPTDFTRIWLGSGGGGQAGTVLNMRGLIDDFALFGSALSTNEIQQLFAGTSPSALPSSAKALAYWDFSASAVAQPSPILNISRSGSAVTISWSVSGFRLRSSSAINGTYADVPGVTGNSYTVTNPTGTLFYKLQN